MESERYTKQNGGVVQTTTDKLAYDARKTIFSSSRRPEKMVFSKELHWNIIFLVLSGKMGVFFPETMTFVLWAENER